MHIIETHLHLSCDSFGCAASVGWCFDMEHDGTLTELARFGDLVTEINDTSLQYVMYPPPAGTEEGGKMVLPTS